MNYTKQIFDHYFLLLLKKCNINDSDCAAEIQEATSELISKINELEERIEQLEKS